MANGHLLVLWTSGRKMLLVFGNFYLFLTSGRPLNLSAVMTGLVCLIQRVVLCTTSGWNVSPSQDNKFEFSLSYPVSRGPSIFLDKSGRGRDLCQPPRLSPLRCAKFKCNRALSASLQLTCLLNDSRVYYKLF